MAGDNDEIDDDKQPPECDQSNPQEASASGTSAEKASQEAKPQETEELLKQTLKEKEEYKDKYLRALAEMENFHKRIKKEKDEFQKYLFGDFVLDILPIYDNLERAIKAELSCTGETSMVSGIKIILNQFHDLLKKKHVLEINALNMPFNPDLHQALTKVEMSQLTEPTVIEVFQKGFTFKGKLLRPALVKVGIPKEVEDTIIEQS